MFSSFKWVRTVFQLLAMIVVITGAIELVRRSKSGVPGSHVSAAVRAPDPETTSSVLKIVDSPPGSTRGK